MNILITGSSKGIGRALAFECAANNHNLILNARSADLLEKLSQEIKAQYKVNVYCVVLDLSQKGADKQLIEQLNNRNLEVDCLINNAGIGYLGDFTEMTEERVENILSLNIDVLTRLTLYYAKEFKRRKEGYILQVASTAAFLPGPYMSLYYASKAFVLNLSRAIRYELKGTGVSLSTLCPGPTKTNFVHEAEMEKSRMAKGIIGMMSAKEVAKIAYTGMMQKKSVIIPGFFNKLLAHSIRFTPTALALWIISKIHQKK